MWPNNRILELFGIQLPIIQAPMAGSVFSEMVVAVSESGALGSLPCALLSLEQMRTELEAIRHQTNRPIHVNFFCHTPPRVDANREKLWKQRLQRYYVELGVDQNMAIPSGQPGAFRRQAVRPSRRIPPRGGEFSFWSSGRKTGSKGPRYGDEDTFFSHFGG